MAFDAPVVFTPKSQADIENAELETEYVSHVFYNGNDYFGEITTW
jgi:hypothetical protein